MRCCPPPSWPLLVLVGCILHLGHVLAAAGVRVSSGPQFAAAISDPAVNTVLVDAPIALEEGDFGPHITRLTRNLTITSDAAGPHQVIDFNARDVRNKISIAPGFNLSFVHLTLKNTRYGPGADVDILADSPDGILYLTDTAKLQTSCPPLVQKTILAYVRDDTVPGVNKIGFPPTVVWDGGHYSDPIVYKDFSTRMATGENGADRGYVVHKRYSWKVCTKVADPACVAASTIAACIKQDLDEEYFLTHPRPSPANLPPAAIAGIAVGAAAGAAALLSAAVLLVRRNKRCKQHAKMASLLPVSGLPKHLQNGSDSGSGSGGQSAGSGRGRRGSKDSSSDSVDSLVRPRSIQMTPDSARGGSVDSCGSACKVLAVGSPSVLKARAAGLPTILKGTLTEEQAADVQLGVLVGAGSFGRVFAGRLGDQEVAIKVLHHDDAAALQVASEVSLMMQFNHPNLVKAFHYVTWGSAGLSRRLTRSDSQEVEDSARLRSVLGSGSSNGSGPSSSACDRPKPQYGRLPAHSRMLETWILCELANVGNMQDAVMLREHSVFFEGETPQMGIILQTMLGVARGMECLHANNCLHGDLKASNVLLSVTEPSVGDGSEASVGEVEIVPKVSDFGLSRVMLEGATHHSTHTMGTITHQAPELMKSGRLSKAADVFSFGVMMWEVFAAAHPWKGMTMGEVMSAVMIEGKRLVWGPGVPKYYASLAEQCWQADADARPSFVQLVVALEGLLQQHESLQKEVDKANRRIGTW